MEKIKKNTIHFILIQSAKLFHLFINFNVTTVNSNVVKLSQTKSLSSLYEEFGKPRELEYSLMKERDGKYNLKNPPNSKEKTKSQNYKT